MLPRVRLVWEEGWVHFISTAKCQQKKSQDAKSVVKTTTQEQSCFRREQTLCPVYAYGRQPYAEYTVQVNLAMRYLRPRDTYPRMSPEFVSLLVA